MTVPFDPVALRFLASHEAQLLAAAWPSVGSDFRRDDASFARWAEAAGVPTRHGLLLGPTLIASGVCLPGGDLPREVRAFITGAAVSLGRVARQRKTKPRRDA